MEDRILHFVVAAAGLFPLTNHGLLRGGVHVHVVKSRGPFKRAIALGGKDEGPRDYERPLRDLARLIHAN